MARPRLPLDEQAVCDAYTGGQTIPSIADALNVDDSRVKRTLLEASIELRDDRGRGQITTPILTERAIAASVTEFVRDQARAHQVPRHQVRAIITAHLGERPHEPA